MSTDALPQVVRDVRNSHVTFEQAAIGMALVDVDGAFVAVNPALCQLVGRTEDELLRTGWQAITHAEDVARGEEEVGRALQGEGRTFRMPKRYIRPDGEVVWVLLTVSLVCSQRGEPMYLLTQVIDITEKRRVEEELARTMAALGRALDEARRSEAGARAFLSDAAHHLRNPVAGVRACTESLLRGSDVEGTERLLAEIARGTAYVSRLVDRLLRIARLAQGEPLKMEVCDVTNLCLDEVERAKSLVPHLEIVTVADASVTHAVDVIAVREILRNLLENATRHAEHRVDVSLMKSGDSIELHVTDDGPGLTSAAQVHAFEPFVSLDGKGGSGLGLTVSRTLARAHGGSLAYEGRTFILSLH